jgi:CRISPR-associated protein Csx10
MSSNKKSKKNHKKSALSNRKTLKQNFSTVVDKTQNLPLVPKSQFNAILTMVSDWHIGCGAGRSGDVDSLVQRDREGLPYIPAKTLTGIWRDACELVALGLDDGENGCWQKWIDYLFGDQPADSKPPLLEQPPRHAALSVRAAHLPDSMCEVLKYRPDSKEDKPALRDALTFVKPGISIDPKSGCAIEDYLRYEEMVRGGTVLQAKCELTLPEDEDQKRAAYALLVAGTQLVERLGGKRRRGAGKCQLVVEQEIKPWIDWIEAHPEPPSLPDLSEASQLASTEDIQIDRNDTWLQIKLTITAKSPVIVAAKTVGNVVKTLDYIPGTHLLRLINKKLDGLGIAVNSAIAQGDLVVTNATVEVKGQQGRPVPLSLFYEKLGGGLEKGGQVYNRCVELEPEGRQLKGERGGYISSTNGSQLPEYEKVNLSIETHNTIQDDVQRPTSEVGGVYSYQAIEPGARLQAELKLQKALADALSSKKKEWWKCLNGDNRLGQSKKDDYGAVSLEVLGEPVPVPKANEFTGTELTVWLLSDVLLRDERLRPTTSIKHLAKKLEQVLGVTLTQRAEDGKLLSLMARQHRIDSWQVRWGLPRPSLVGLAAGTCVVFTVEGTLDPSKLAQIQASGIGERRAEGFGQICFNDPILTAATSTLEAATEQKNKQTQESGQLISESDCAFSYARIVEKAAWREAIRQEVLQVAASPSTRKSVLGIEPKKPTMSQLGALRSVLGRLQQPEEDPEHPGAVTRWLNHLERTPNRRDKWCHESLQKIRTLVSSKSQIWLTLNIKFEDVTLTTTGERELKGELWKESEQLWTEAVQTLVDACIRAHKRDLENQLDTQEGESHGA